MTEIYIFDRDFNLFGIVDSYVSVIWRPSYNDIGDFEIYLGATEQATELLKENRYAVRSTDISVDGSGNVTYKKVMIIKNVHLVTDVENGDFLTVTGKELKYLLHQRIVWRQTILTGTAEDAMRRLVTENAIAPTDTNRVLPGLVLGDKAKNNLLPDNYTQLEYIEGTGTQYIDTGVVADVTGYSVVIDFKYTGDSYASTTQQQWLCGCGRYHEAGIYRGAFYTDGCFSYSQTANISNRTTAKNVKVPSTPSGASMFLFARNYVGNESEYRPSLFRIYSAKILYNGEPVREFIPCKNPSGEVGLYDGVTGSFYANAGTGEFVAGSVAVSKLMDTIEKQVTGKHLDETITEICTAFNYGWDIYAYNNQFVFVIYQGVNKSYGQTARPYVVFSDEFDNLYNTEYQLNTEQYANTALVGGEGEGLDRFYVTVGAENKGFERFETLVDSRNSSRNSGSENEITDSEYTKMLQEEGAETLAGLSYTEGFTGEVLSDVTFKYGTDFYLGDLVTVKTKYGIEKNVRVISAIESEDESGIKLVPQFNI